MQQYHVCYQLRLHRIESGWTRVRRRLCNIKRVLGLKGVLNYLEVVECLLLVTLCFVISARN